METLDGIIRIDDDEVIGVGAGGRWDLVRSLIGKKKEE